jgi:pyridoxamine 5'-phosphate oxidase
VSAFDDLRRDYGGTPLLEETAGDDPFVLFGRWFQDTIDEKIDLANGMVLATASPDGRPSARVVLLKSWDRDGFVFFTDYGSRKGEELAANPAAALLFWWPPLARQVRIEGGARGVSAIESNEYFDNRPRDANLSAMASEQSRPIESRAALDARVAECAHKWDGLDLVRPPGWGGYRIAPDRFEFWQGRPSRLHDRLVYRLNDDRVWTRERLCP